MLSASRRWLQRYRAPLAVGVGIVSATYVAAQYVVGRMEEARERLTSERLAKDKWARISRRKREILLQR